MFTHRHNFPWGCGEYIPRSDLGEKGIQQLYNLSDEDMEVVSEFFPFGAYGIHTIHEVEMWPAVEKVKLF